MSDLLNHYYCGEMALEKLGYGPKNIIELNRDLFDLGCQGPDFFLYNVASISRKKRNIRKYGGMIHNCPTSELFYTMAKLTKSTGDQALNKKFASYLFGYVCHHTLDSITHPFIFYFSGVRDDNNPKTYIYSNYHKRLEVYLDIFMAEKLGKKGPLKFPMDEIFKLNSLDRSVVYEVHKEVFDRLFNLQLTKKEVDISLNKTASLLNFFPDQKGIKLKFFTFIEKIIRQPYLISKAIVTKDIEDADDYMNLNHEKWLHPCDKNEIRYESYPDLFYKAVEESYKKINKVYDLIYNEELTEEKIDSIFKNISFETGKPVSKDPKETKIMVNYKVKKI